MAQTTNVKKERVVVGRSLINLVFSWSIKDVLNNGLYKHQVKQIPNTFSSETGYFNSFIAPLVEETHADLLSSVKQVSQSICCEIKSIKRTKDYKPPKDLFYKLVLKVSERKNDLKAYEPQNGDLIAITSVRPRCTSDLQRSYVIALVQGVKDDLATLTVLASKPILNEDRRDKNKTESVFAVYLINMTTNIRIWQALTSDPKERNMKIIEKDAKDCMICHSEQDCGIAYSDAKTIIKSSDLNVSQQDAVLSCIRTIECRHQNTVKLIWGPPGTGKTKTVGFLLHSLLGMKCRTLTCAPTNVAVLEVTERLMKRVRESAKYDTYGLGDIVLFGNGERMKIEERDELCDVFLDHRIDILNHCFASKTGWRDSLLSMIGFLEDPEEQYRLCLKEGEVKDLEEDDSDDDDGVEKANSDSGNRDTNSNQEGKEKKSKQALKQVILQNVKENKKNKKKLKDKSKDKDSKQDDKKDGNDISRNKEVSPLNFEEFSKKKFSCIAERLNFCIVNLYTHLPTSLISLKVVETMLAAVDSLESLQKLLYGVANGALRQVFNKDAISKGGSFAKFNVARMKSLALLKSLPSTFPVPQSSNSYSDAKEIIDFCLANACLIFCTVSSSAKLHNKGIPLELLVIDEAAQLKECESTIPLQLHGIRNAILIGDEQQLPAMVKSKVSEEADFGRSLFERLALLGHKKHLLNVQHRMHPSISLFPNRHFYDNKISDGPNVKLGSCSKSFLQGKMYGSYSFINVAHGKETFDNKHSSKNMVEVAVVSEILASLYKEVKSTKKMARVGVVSPYKAQVYAISEIIGKKYSSDAQSDFSVSVRSVDGFQGGEEDVIIISTVRSNDSGSVGFLSNHQRANVALTRARHCLWIVGNGETLGKSSSIWKKLALDAKERKCFHNADNDKNLALAITAALVQLNQIHLLPNLDSLLFREARWKVCFNDAFWTSLARVKENELCKEMLSLLQKLSCGWRQARKESNLFKNSGTSTQIVEHYKVNHMYIVWTVDILREKSHHIQILKVWDVLVLSDVPKLSNQLETLYRNYSQDKMSRCKYTHKEGNLVVPIKWPVDSSTDVADPVHLLSKPLASLSLKDEPETSTRTNSDHLGVGDQTMQNTNKAKKERVVVGRSLIDLVFSWSIRDVLNNDLYKQQVKKIPNTFSSTTEYFKSFVTPLVEETHADLLSSVRMVSQSPCREIESVKLTKDCKPPNELFYKIALKVNERKNDPKAYEPADGDLIAVTRVRPRCHNDLGRSFVIASVQGVKNDVATLLSSKPILVEDYMDKNKKTGTLFAVYLINMTTNIRIWQALTSDPKERNMKIIEKVLQAEVVGEEKCMACHAEQSSSTSYSDAKARIRSSELNESQQDAVLGCIKTIECRHQNTVKLIWGPPGTGKTKTVGFLLHSLLMMKRRALTCAPTNVAVLAVTERLVKTVTESAKYGTYGLGDIVLSGNLERMMIEECDELYDVFLDHRIEILDYCFAPKTGWRDSLLSMICLLEDPVEQYRLYLREFEREDLVDDDSDDDWKKTSINLENQDEKQEGGDISDKISEEKKSKKASKQIILRSLKENKNNQQSSEDKNEEKYSNHEGTKDKNALSGSTENLEHVSPLTFEEFLKKKFSCVAERLYFCITNLYTHLPTSLISLEVVDTMVAAVDSLKSFHMLLYGVANEALEQVFEKDISEGGSFAKLNVARIKTLLILKSLPSTFPVPHYTNSFFDTKAVMDFCLENACLIFCTVSSSAKLHNKGMMPLELLVIDEAAQLKECESTIPLQLPGIRQAILIGDEWQLPPMVKSKVSEKAEFGRSLFERLALLGLKRHLLNVQHRMHPSISLFPNSQFYDNKVLDGENVKLSYSTKTFLQGKMYGPYSFINVAQGNEAFDNKRSSKNMVEVAVVSDLVARLYKEAKSTNKKVRVGVISPYKAQVYAIREIIGKKYSSDAQSDFSVSVRSVDGFQGGEEDVIIISTVRSNGNGSLGFLANPQRANVALTRARHCLWIVGNGATLYNSCSVWNKLVMDAKQRKCFHNADEDKNLALAITGALIQLNQIHLLPNLDSLLFRESVWKMVFNDSFWRSMTRVKDDEFCKEMFSLLEKLSCGWRQVNKEGNPSTSQLVERYKIKQMYLVWTVDLLKENSHHVQILKVWDVLVLSDVPKLTNQLEILYGSYSLDKRNRCKYKYKEGNLLLPMKWPVDSTSDEADLVHFLSKPLASLSLKDEPETSTTNRVTGLATLGELCIWIVDRVK
ncbi:P-loop containing nucleoside triphosphate hydrolase [Trema orientale]|uniref:P-loop containing nucleoside triphosphate hydrolase n=1 Tax=Trema orientale TaxID=63057 RepID=A0A2P5EQ39_TREOI|nr:P-loop containing nucleoside triphosphate hydrolase [Trema orientale]